MSLQGYCGWFLTPGGPDLSANTLPNIGSVQQEINREDSTVKTVEETTPSKEESLIDLLDTREDLHMQRVSPVDEVEKVLLEGSPKKYLQIGSCLQEPLKTKLVNFLRANLDVFAWTPSDMPRIDPEVIAHELNIQPQFKPVKQKKRCLGLDRQMAAEEEVEKLLQAGFIQEITYLEWLANVVLVKKSNGKWRMCVDFTDLNDACPKDHYPLPRIDQVIDRASGHQMLSFMDAFSGYNQILMADKDKEKTAFITESGTYHYNVMPFGLKNAGATYQRLVNKIFKKQVGRNIEVYVDDMLVKSAVEMDHIRDLEETFGVLRDYQMKLNPRSASLESDRASSWGS